MFSGFITTTGESCGSYTEKIYGIDIDSRTTSNHETALTLACGHKYYDLAKLLLDYGANIEQKDNMGRTPLMTAANRDSKETVKFLLDNNANIETLIYTRDTPLTLACKMGFYDVIENIIFTEFYKKTDLISIFYLGLSCIASKRG